MNVYVCAVIVILLTEHEKKKRMMLKIHSLLENGESF